MQNRTRTTARPATPPPVFVDEFAAAALLGLSVHTMRADRLGARKFPYVKLGNLVRYSPARLLVFAESCEVGGTRRTEAEVQS